MHVELWEIIIITILVKIIFTVHIISIIKIQEPAWQTILGVVRHRQLSKVSKNHTRFHIHTDIIFVIAIIVAVFFIVYV